MENALLVIASFGLLILAIYFSQERVRPVRKLGTESSATKAKRSLMGLAIALVGLLANILQLADKFIGNETVGLIISLVSWGAIAVACFIVPKLIP